jgi:hypothetical protein
MKSASTPSSAMLRVGSLFIAAIFAILGAGISHGAPAKYGLIQEFAGNEVNFGEYSKIVRLKTGNGIIAHDFTKFTDNIALVMLNADCSSSTLKWKIINIGFIHDIEYLNGDDQIILACVFDDKINKYAIKLIDISGNGYKIHDYPLDYEADQVAIGVFGGERMIAVSKVSKRLDEDAESSLELYKIVHNKLQIVDEINGLYNVGDIEVIPDASGNATLAVIESDKIGPANILLFDRVLCFYRVEKGHFVQLERIKLNGNPSPPNPVISYDPATGNLLLCDSEKVSVFDTKLKKFGEQVARAEQGKHYRGISATVDEHGKTIIFINSWNSTVHGVRYNKMKSELFKRNE